MAEFLSDVQLANAYFASRHVYWSLEKVQFLFL